MTETELLQLEGRVANLMRWKEDMSRERLTFPLDFESQRIKNSSVIVFEKDTNFSIESLGTDLTCFGLEVSINNQIRSIFASYPLKPITANAGSNVITSTNGPHGLTNNNVIAFTTTGTLPAGLNTTTQYYVISSTSTTFKVSTSLGGSEVDITDAGSGTHYLSLQ